MPSVPVVIRIETESTASLKVALGATDVATSVALVMGTWLVIVGFVVSLGPVVLKTTSTQ